jgi:HD-like signal output (HDOD) protein
MLVHSNGGYMDVDLSYQLGFVHGLRSLPLFKEWMDAMYVLGYAEGQKTKRLFIEQEHERFFENIVVDRCV